MTSPAWRTAEVVAVAVALGLVVAVLARSLGRSEAKKEAATVIAELTAKRLADLYRQERKVTEARAEERALAEARQAVANRRLSAALADTRAQLADARAVLADTAASIPDLRDMLSITTQRAESLVTVVEAFQAATDSANAAHARERAALMSVLTYTDSTATAWKRAYEASQRAGRCRVLFLPCPSRTTSALLGAAGAAALIVSLNR